MAGEDAAVVLMVYGPGFNVTELHEDRARLRCVVHRRARRRLRRQRSRVLEVVVVEGVGESRGGGIVPRALRSDRTGEGASRLDIVAGRGTMGLDQHSLAVTVKSADTPEGENANREPQCVLKRFSTAQGLFVSWTGYKTSVERRRRQLFCEVRLWDADDVIDTLISIREPPR